MTCHTCHPATSAKQITQLFYKQKNYFLPSLKGAINYFFSHESYKRHVADVAAWQISPPNA